MFGHVWPRNGFQWFRYGFHGFLMFFNGSVALPTSTRHIPNSICFAPCNQDTPCSQNYGFTCFCNALGLAVLWTPSQANVFQKGHGTIGVPTVPWFGRLAFLIFHIAGPHSLGTWSWEPGLIIFSYRWGGNFHIAVFMDHAPDVLREGGERWGSR